MQKDNLPKIISLWFLKLLWRFVRWSVTTVYYRFVPHKMCLAPSREVVEAFYKSKKWYRLSLWAKNKYGRQCMKCFKNPEAYPRLQLNTDHIKPVWYYWHLRLDPNNLQVLCAGCNKAKGSVDMTDYRGYRPGKTPLRQPNPHVTPPRRQVQIASTYYLRERGWS